MKLLVLGGGGQLGTELTRCVPDDMSAVFLGRDKLDVTCQAEVLQQLRLIKPDMIINAAAYTNVDGAESDSENAFLVNRDGPVNLALAAKDVGSRLIHVSTDFVFDGLQSHPYSPDDDTNPINTYGLSKLEGEKGVIEVLGNRCAIIRTSWLYSRYGNNFVKTMLKLMNERDELKVVYDQVGSPCWAAGLARVIFEMSGREMSGIYHWADSGVASWYDFSVAIQEEALKIGLINSAIPITPIRAIEYPTAAARPFYSVLDKADLVEKLGKGYLHWRESLRLMLRECLIS